MLGNQRENLAEDLEGQGSKPVQQSAESAFVPKQLAAQDQSVLVHAAEEERKAESGKAKGVGEAEAVRN